MEKQVLDKEDTKRWPEVNVPLSLSDALQRFTKTELSAIRMQCGLSSGSSLKKDQLIDSLATEIPAALGHMLGKMDESRLELLKKVSSRGGQLALSLTDRETDYFLERGLLFPATMSGKRTYVMPAQVLEALRALKPASLRETAARNTEWLRLTHGMLHYYGTLTYSELLSLLEKYTGSVPSQTELLAVIGEAAAYEGRPKVDTAGVTAGEAWSAAQVKVEQLARPDLTFYPFTKEQLLQAGEAGYLDRTEAFEGLVDFLAASAGNSRKDAEVAARDFFYLLQNGNTPAELMQSAQEQLKIKDKTVVMPLHAYLVRLHNAMRRWSLKGFSSNELSGSAAATANGTEIAVQSNTANRKIGRNEPCPCGSGKKYKKCCGA